MSTGSLGLGVSAAAGMALAAKLEGSPRRVYCLVGDGELQEGIVWEAAMAASHYRLDNLLVIVDNNGMQIDGDVRDVMSPYPIRDKFERFGFAAADVDGHDFADIRKAYAWARGVGGRPCAIVAKTVKGKGVPFMENSAAWHGKAPSNEEYEAALAALGEGEES
jgi:transketolase